MYHYVQRAKYRKYHLICLDALNQVYAKLRAKYGIRAYAQLIGSGAQNFVTRNGDGPYDLDYNFVFTKLPAPYGDNLGQLKDTFRRLLDKEISHSFSYGKASKSVLTYSITQGTQLIFSFDVALIYRNPESGTQFRLQLDRKSDRFLWNQIRYSEAISRKVRAIKNARQEGRLKDKYLQLKNLYLERQDQDHPSFVVYIEAVNEVYSKYCH